MLRIVDRSEYFRRFTGPSGGPKLVLLRGAECGSEASQELLEFILYVSAHTCAIILNDASFEVHECLKDIQQLSNELRFSKVIQEAQKSSGNYIDAQQCLFVTCDPASARHACQETLQVAYLQSPGEANLLEAAVRVAFGDTSPLHQRVLIS